MATIYDIAKKAGVSITTVSRVINNHPYVKAETREHVKALLKEMRFIPNSNASSLVRKTTRTIAVIVPDITNHFFTILLRGAEDKANENGFAVILGNTDESIQKEQTYIQMFLERRVDGLIIDPISSKGKNLRPIIRRDIPLVVVDREVPGLAVDYVGSDNHRGACNLVHHLIAVGHRRIALITGSPEISVYRQRTEGYLAALEKSGIPADDSLIMYGDKPSKEVGYELTKKLMHSSPPPTVIFAANNFLANGVVMALKEENMAVPLDIGVVCFDDIDSPAVLAPFFTSVNQPVYMMGQMAVDLLLRQMKSGKVEPTRVILESTLCFRQSEGIPK